MATNVSAQTNVKESIDVFPGIHVIVPPRRLTLSQIEPYTKKYGC